MSRSRLQNFEILRYKVRTLSDYSSSKRYTSISHLQQRSNEALTFTCSYKKKILYRQNARKKTPKYPRIDKPISNLPPVSPASVPN